MQFLSFFLRHTRAIYEFGASQRLGMMVCMVSRMKQCIWKGCRSIEKDLESLGLWLENWIWKVKREDGEMGKGYIEGYILTSPLKESTKR